MIIAVIPNPYLLIVFVILLPLLLGFRYYYITTAREVKRLEALGELSKVLCNIICKYIII